MSEKRKARPDNVASAIVDCVQTATAKWTRQKKSEERHPGNVRYRVSRMTREPRMTQKDAAWQILVEAYMAASDDGKLPAKARQIFYQARPKIMALTDDKELQYGYFSQTVLPDYVEEHHLDWDVVYDARGHFTEPHTNRRIGCGTVEVRNYLNAARKPRVVDADFEDASVSVIGPSGNLAGVLYCEKEGFDPLFRAVNLADLRDLMILSNKGVSVTAGRRLVDAICGENGLPLFVLHDFDTAGFMIVGTFQRDTRRYQFTSAVEVIDLGLRLTDIEGLEREPAAATKMKPSVLRDQLAKNGATDAEIGILVNERVELNAMTSRALISMIEAKLDAYGLKKVVPDDDMLAETWRAFRRSKELRDRFEELEAEFDAEEKDPEGEAPADLGERVRAVLAQHKDLRWDDAVRLVPDERQLEFVRAEKQKAKEKSGDFTGASEDDDTAGAA